MKSVLQGAIVLPVFLHDICLKINKGTMIIVIKK